MYSIFYLNGYLTMEHPFFSLLDKTRLNLIMMMLFLYIFPLYTVEKTNNFLLHIGCYHVNIENMINVT